MIAVYILLGVVVIGYVILNELRWHALDEYIDSTYDDYLKILNILYKLEHTKEDTDDGK